MRNAKANRAILAGSAVVAISMLGVSKCAQAQAIATWDIADTVTDAQSWNAVITPFPATYVAPNAIGGPLTVNADNWSNGTTAAGYGTIGTSAGYATDEADVLSYNMSSEISLQAQPGSVLNLSKLDIWVQSGADGGSIWVYSGTPTLGSSIANDAIPGNGIGWTTFPGPLSTLSAPWLIQVDLSGPAYQGLTSADLTVFYNSPGGGWYDMLGGEQLEGTVAPAAAVPEPASLGLLALGGVGLLARRRRRA